MLGPTQPYGIKSIAKRGLGSSRQRIIGRTIEELSKGSVTTGWISVIYVFLPVLAIIVFKFRIVSNKTNDYLCYPNC